MAVTTAAVVGIASSAAGAVTSFSESAKQGNLAETAAAQAKKSMAEAKKRAEKDLYAGLNVSTEAYDNAFKNNLATQQQNIEALQGGDARTLAAGVGLVQGAADKTAEATRLALQKDLEANAKMKADSANAINQDLKRMDLGLASQSAKESAEAGAASAAAFSQGVSGVGGLLQDAAYVVPLFGNPDNKAENEEAFLKYRQSKSN